MDVHDDAARVGVDVLVGRAALCFPTIVRHIVTESVQLLVLIERGSGSKGSSRESKRGMGDCVSSLGMDDCK
jgi:hypothetical protein